MKLVSEILNALFQVYVVVLVLNLKDGKKTLKITNAQVKKWLGPEIFEHGVKNKKDEVE